jgi:hypothetical protein
MGADIRKENETFQADYDKLYAKGAWDKDALCMMKDLKKLIYYNLAIEGMQNGQGFPGSEHMGEMSYARGRDSLGRYTSGDMSREYRDPWDREYSGRRYYDSEKEKAIHKLHHMMENTDDPERKNALKIAINELEQK